MVPHSLPQLGHSKPGQWVLVHGATGGVGVATVQLALAAGLRVIGTAGTPDGHALLQSLGVEHGADGA